MKSKINKQKPTKARQESPFNKGAVSEADWGFFTSKNGITLIALIITVIVMLILVSVTIGLTVNSDIFGKAQEAGREWQQNEVNIAQNAASFIDEAVKQATRTTTLIETANAINKDFNETTVKKVAQTKTANKTYEAPIPYGFEVSGLESERHIDDGLVIYQVSKNEPIDWTNETVNMQQTYDQFVWVPIDRTQINDMYICQAKTENNGECVLKLDEVNDEIYCDTHDTIDAEKSKLMAGNLYTDGAMTSKVTHYTPDSGRREPDWISK